MNRKSFILVCRLVGCILFVLSMIIISCGDSSDKGSKYNKWLDKNENEIIDEVTKLSDRDIDLGAVILAFSKIYYPEINIRKYLTILDKMAEELKVQIGNEKQPRKTIKMINDYIYKTNKFKPLREILKEIGNDKYPESLLSKVLDSKVGSCFGLSILYLSLAERLNLSIYGVLSPEHILIRYDDGKYQIDIETIYDGIELSREFYLTEQEKYKKWNKKDIEYYGYFNNLSKREVIEEFLLSMARKNYIKNIKNRNDDNWQRVIKVTSNPARVYYIIAIFLTFSDQIEDKNYSEALFYLNKSIELNPNYYGLYEIKGYIYDELKKTDEAISSYTKAIELYPISVRTYCARGEIYGQMKQYDKAFADFGKAIELDPSYYLGYYNRGEVLFDKGEYDKALDDFNTTVRLAPQFTSVYYDRGKTFMKMKKYKEALNDFEYFIIVRPGSILIENVIMYIQRIKSEEFGESK